MKRIFTGRHWKIPASASAYSRHLVYLVKCKSFNFSQEDKSVESMKPGNLNSQKQTRVLLASVTRSPFDWLDLLVFQPDQKCLSARTGKRKWQTRVSVTTEFYIIAGCILSIILLTPILPSYLNYGVYVVHSPSICRICKNLIYFPYCVATSHQVVEAVALEAENHRRNPCSQWEPNEFNRPKLDPRILSSWAGCSSHSNIPQSLYYLPLIVSVIW